MTLEKLKVKISELKGHDGEDLCVWLDDEGYIALGWNCGKDGDCAGDQYQHSQVVWLKPKGDPETALEMLELMFSNAAYMYE